MNTLINNGNENLAKQSLKEICDFLMSTVHDPNRKREYSSLKSEPLTITKYNRVRNLIYEHARLILLRKDHWLLQDIEHEQEWGFRRIELPRHDKSEIQNADFQDLCFWQQSSDEKVSYLLISEKVERAIADRLIPLEESTSKSGCLIA